jgi:hypothetical protein
MGMAAVMREPRREAREARADGARQAAAACGHAGGAIHAGA